MRLKKTTTTSTTPEHPKTVAFLSSNIELNATIIVLFYISFPVLRLPFPPPALNNSKFMLSCHGNCSFTAGENIDNMVLRDDCASRPGTEPGRLASSRETMLEETVGPPGEEGDAFMSGEEAKDGPGGSIRETFCKICCVAISPGKGNKDYFFLVFFFFFLGEFSLFASPV